MRGVFVTATDTEVGKTVVSAAIAAALLAEGVPTRAFKPAVTGLDEPVEGVLADHELLALVTGDDPDAVAPHRFGPAVSPHFAAEQVGMRLDPCELVAAAKAQGAAAGDDGALVVEGVGGLMVPLADVFFVRDLALMLGLPVIVAARPGLGTINHTLLTLGDAQANGLDVRAVVLTPWPDEPSEMELSNRRTLERLAGVEVCVLPRVAAMTPGSLAAAGATLRPARWLQPD